MGEPVELVETAEMDEEGQVIKIRLSDPEARVIEIKLSNSEVTLLREHYLAQQKSIECLVKRKKSQRARYSYGIIFLLTNLIAWAVRDYGQIVFSDLHYVKACGIEGRSCYQKMGVLRVSLGCFMFFFIMFLVTFKTSKLYEGGNLRHSEWWALKFLIWFISLVTSLFVPSGFIQLYGEVARVGAGVFLVLQLISVIEFITWWNTYWTAEERKKQRCFLGLFMSTLFYIASMCGIGVMYSLYAPSASCSLNIFFITWTAILLLVMMAMSLYSKVNRGLLSSGIMASYIVFLCWSAIRSEPASEKCGAQRQGNGHDDWTSILGFLIAICSIVMATFSTGIDSKTFQFRKNEPQVEDDIPYQYGFFHLVFSLGAMYFAMLFISWNLSSPTTKWSMDVGWASTWVKIVNEWFAATIYSPVVDAERLKKYVVHKISNEMPEGPFCIVYMHTTVQKDDNSPGMSILRWIYEELTADIKDRLQVVYFIHPGLRSRLVFATLGRLLLSGGLYWKIKYISRLEYLWEDVKKGDVDIPQFVQEHDKILENRPLTDYGIEPDPLHLTAIPSAGYPFGRFEERWSSREYMS